MLPLLSSCRPEGWVHQRILFCRHGRRPAILGSAASCGCHLQHRQGEKRSRAERSIAGTCPESQTNLRRLCCPLPLPAAHVLRAAGRHCRRHNQQGSQRVGVRQRVLRQLHLRCICLLPSRPAGRVRSSRACALLLSAAHSQLRQQLFAGIHIGPTPLSTTVLLRHPNVLFFSLGAIHPSLYSLSVSHPPALPCPAAAPCRATAAVTPQPWLRATAYCKATPTPSRRRSSNWTVRTLGAPGGVQKCMAASLCWFRLVAQPHVWKLSSVPPAPC